MGASWQGSGVRTSLLILALALTCCGAPAESPVPLVLSPSEDARAVTEDWSSRWSAASGIPVSVGASGTPVVLADDVWVTDSEAFDHQVPGSTRACAATQSKRTGVVELIMVDRTPKGGCRGGWGYTLGHEIGHALAFKAPNQHSDDGTFMGETLLPGIAYGIDAPSLEVVCAHAPCVAFNPED